MECSDFTAYVYERWRRRRWLRDIYPSRSRITAFVAVLCFFTNCTLVVAGLDSSISEIDVGRVIEAKAQTNATLACDSLPLPVGVKFVRLEWRQGDRKLVEHRRNTTTVWSNPERTKLITETYALHFNPVLSEDNGEYVCLVNDASVESVPVIRLFVQDVPSPPGKPLVMGFTSRSVNLSWTASLGVNNSPVRNYVIYTRVGEDGDWDTSGGIVTPTNATSHHVVGLKPYTVYSFRVIAVNSVGQSLPSKETFYIFTLREVPDGKPTITAANNASDSSVRVEWLPPEKDTINGEFIGYHISYKIRDQPGDILQNITLRDPTATGCTIKSLKPFTQYIVSVQVFNPEGIGPATTIVVMTDAGVPSKPSHLRIVQVTNNIIKLEWSQPESPNGIIQGYRLYYMHKNYTDVRTLRNPEPKMEYVLTDLEPYRAYKIWIKAFTSKYEGEPSEILTIWTDVEGPSSPQILNLTCQSHDTLYLQWQRPHLFYHQVDYYYVHYRSMDTYDFKNLAIESASNREDNTMFITNLTGNAMYEVKIRGATRSLVDRSLEYKGAFSDLRKVLLQPRCSRPDLSLSSSTPIIADPEYVSAGMIAGLVCASFTLIFAILALILWRKCFQGSYYYLDDPPPPKNNVAQLNMTDIYDESEYPSIPVHLWPKHVANLHADGDIGFSKEYEAIQQATVSDLMAEQSQTTDNKVKNRYLNIVAYDHSRVVLRQIPVQKKCSDYINANYIDGYYKPRAYIGTQGPLPSTFADFWRMVWEQRVVIIVMITNLIERGRVSEDTRKCDHYWPKEGSEMYGFFQVKLIQETVLATYTVRAFTLRNVKVRKKHQSERTVFQYHYTNWPDHGVPEHPLPVLSFVRKSAAANPEDAGPIIVHCSAGVGRTGTYIVLDAMLRQIKDVRDVNVFGFLKYIRSQRNYLVQTEEQYIFIHDALLEAIESGETEIGLPYLSRYLQSLQTSAAAERTSYICNGDPLGVVGVPNMPAYSWQLLDQQFKLVTSFVPKDFHATNANKTCNVSKNRCADSIPVESHRVHITPKPGLDGSDYINATFLQGFHRLREFIVTQHPTQDTAPDFWQMIYDHNVQTIVLISAVDDHNWEPFWPTKDDPFITEHFSAKLANEIDYANYQTKDFILQSNQDDYELMCHLIYCPSWPECCSPLSSVFDLIRAVQKFSAEIHNSPVVVVDRYGGTEAASFCCLTTLLKQQEFENRVDVYQYAKLCHMRRPGVWKSQDDYLFLYRAVDSLVSGNCTPDSVSHQSVNGGHLNGHLLPSTQHLSVINNSSRRSSFNVDATSTPAAVAVSIVPDHSLSSRTSSPTLPSPSAIVGCGSPV